MPEFCLTNTSECPPDGYNYTEPTTGAVFKHYDYNAFFEAISAHKQGNNIPLDPEWREQIVSDMCASRQVLWKEFCRRCEGTGEVRPFSIEAAKSFLTFMKNWLAGGGQYVEPEVAEERARICSGCELNQVFQSKCGSCYNAVLQLVLKIRGNRTTTQDTNLHTCKGCSCSLQVAVHMPLQQQLDAMAPATREKMNGYKWCWKRDQNL